MSDADVVSNQIAAFFAPPLGLRRAAMIRLENKLKSADLFDYYAKFLTGER
jgi:hypothetical protein